MSLLSAKQKPMHWWLPTPLEPLSSGDRDFFSHSTIMGMCTDANSLDVSRWWLDLCINRKRRKIKENVLNPKIKIFCFNWVGKNSHIHYIIFLKFHSGSVKSLIIFKISWLNSMNIVFKVTINSLQRALFFFLSFFFLKSHVTNEERKY